MEITTTTEKRVQVVIKMNGFEREALFGEMELIAKELSSFLDQEGPFTQLLQAIRDSR